MKWLKLKSYTFVIKRVTTLKQKKGFEMKKTILVTAALVGTLTTGAFAYGGNGNGNGKGMKNQQGMQQQTQKKGWHGNKMRQNGNQHNNMMRQRGGNQMFSQLKLTEDQQFKISILRDEMRLEMRKLRGVNKQGKNLKFLGSNGFDKKAFSKERTEMQEKRIALRADHMEKVFKILTKEQIAELKKNLNS